jgi:hypothetical protein
MRSFADDMTYDSVVDSEENGANEICKSIMSSIMLSFIDFMQWSSAEDDANESNSIMDQAVSSVNVKQEADESYSRNVVQSLLMYGGDDAKDMSVKQLFNEISTNSVECYLEYWHNCDEVEDDAPLGGEGREIQVAAAVVSGEGREIQVAAAVVSGEGREIQVAAAVVIIQRNIRGALAREKFGELVERFYCMLIQSIVRGFIVRNRMHHRATLLVD